MKAIRKKNKFLLCFFGPPPEACEAEKSERSIGSSSDKSGQLCLSEEDTKVIRRRCKIACRVFGKIIRSKEKSGAGQIKIGLDPKPSLRKVTAVSDNIFVKETCQKLSDDEDPESGTISSSSCSSPSSSLIPAQEKRLQRKRTPPKNPKMPSTAPRIHGSAPGLFLLILSLSVMLFCGRVLAILWTLTWLCFLSRKASDVGTEAGYPPDEKVEPPATSRSMEMEVYYKKKVVFEGFLERNRRN